MIKNRRTVLTLTAALAASTIAACGSLEGPAVDVEQQEQGMSQSELNRLAFDLAWADLDMEDRANNCLLWSLDEETVYEIYSENFTEEEMPRRDIADNYNRVC